MYMFRMSNLHAFDFDNLLYKFPENAETRCAVAGAHVAVAYLGIGYDEAYELADRSWKEERDTVELIRRHPKCRFTYNELYRQFNSLAGADKLVRPLEGLNEAIMALSNYGECVIVSHSSHNTVLRLGSILEIHPVILNLHSHGIDTDGFGKEHRKDAGVQVFEKIGNKYDVAADKTMLFEDTALNLKFAKMAGWRTSHVHWDNEPTIADYIDRSHRTVVDSIYDLIAEYEELAKPQKHFAYNK